MTRARTANIATTTEVKSQIDQLVKDTPALTRALRDANYRVQKLGTRSRGRTENDLLHDAILACLEGRRKWTTDVPFAQFFRGVLKSIAYHWAREHDTAKTVPDSWTGDVDSGETITDRTQANELSQIELLDGQELKEKIKAAFPGDQIIENVVEGLAIGLDGPTIRTQFSITQNQYEYALEKIRKNRVGD